MTSSDRWEFLRKHGFGFGLLVVVFVLLTVIRSIRDDFGVEIWKQLLSGEEEPSVYSKAETAIAFAVTFINGLAIAIKSNRDALLGSLGLMAAGFCIVLTAVLGHTSGVLSPFLFMVLVGIGLYLPYVTFHTTVFERLIATVRETVNLGYLMYIADAVGYLGYVGVMIFRNRNSEELDMLGLFNSIAVGVSIVSLVLTFGLIWHFHRRLPKNDEPVSAA